MAPAFFFLTLQSFLLSGRSGRAEGIQLGLAGMRHILQSGAGSQSDIEVTRLDWT